MATTGQKLIFRFEEGDASMRDLLGGKGANLCEMARMGLPVPPGFVITTEACRQYYAAGRKLPHDLWPAVREELSWLESATSKKFGGSDNPLLVSVRSGAKFSMPGMMDTVLNLGLNDITATALARLTGDERFALDAFRRFIQLYSKVVLRLDSAQFEEILDDSKREAGVASDSQLRPESLRKLIAEYRELVLAESGRPFPTDPWEQLEAAIAAVFASWSNRRAVDYRAHEGIPDDIGTAVSIVSMVFGNLGDGSGTGVVFSRSPATGEPGLYGEYLANAQGEDVVAGIRTPLKVTDLKMRMPAIYEQLNSLAVRLEEHYRDAQDIEFTVERGTLYILQTRNAKRTATAAVRIAVDLTNEGRIDRDAALERVRPQDIAQLLVPTFEEEALERARSDGRLIANGLGAAPGGATGLAVFDAERAVLMAEMGRRVVLVRPETDPDDVHGILRSEGVLTARGGITSHAAVVTRGLGKPCIVGCESLNVDPEAKRMTSGEMVIREGQAISIDGATGEVFVGELERAKINLTQNSALEEFLKWADEARSLGVYANADNPTDAAIAVSMGAEGIGLCRTEHMFFQTDRLPQVREMLLSAPENSRLENAAEVEGLEGGGRAAQHALAASPAARRFRDALAKLEEFQTDDFRGILRAMGDRPVIIRLLDAPLHEFLPDHEQLLVEAATLRATGDDPERLKDVERELKETADLQESNPMLGHRGCRLGVSYPEIYEMQVRAILRAACDVSAEGIESKPEIMIPLVTDVNELKFLHPKLDAAAKKVLSERKMIIPYLFGTMIETPRAALTAGLLATEAEFFSFGSNDLTQMTFGYSRDDAEGKFLNYYLQRGILAKNPFSELDREGVGRLVRLAVEEGRKGRPGISLGVCGEHGGDPSSIAFCQDAGLDYVSCSPFRLPIARLAAAQAALGVGGASE
jgi:pyruvate, orthophosphate dikinase